MSDVTDIRVLVSGGTSGLGHAMCAALVEGGAQVVLTGRDAARTAEAAAQLARSGPGRAVGVAMDVRDERSVEDGVAAARDALGGVDVLVNNAGIGMQTVNPRFLTEAQPFWMVEPDRFRDLFATNVTGYFLLARAVAPVMARAGTGKIVNVSVSETTMRRAGFFPYGPSRAATDSLSHVMAADLAGTGVTVNLLAPGGATATGMVPDAVGDDVRSRLLDPAIMGPPIRWLASTDSDGITDARVIATDFANGIRPTRESGETRAMIGDIHHLGLTVRSVDSSAAWYSDVLGFERVGDYAAPDGSRRKVFLRHDGLRARIGLTQHRDGPKDAFDEMRVGLDHLAFGVSSRDELDVWARRLTAAGVTHSPVAPANSIPGAAVLVFRDPDNIQLELFFDPSAAEA